MLKMKYDRIPNFKLYAIVRKLQSLALTEQEAMLYICCRYRSFPSESSLWNEVSAICQALHSLSSTDQATIFMRGKLTANYHNHYSIAL